MVQFYQLYTPIPYLMFPRYTIYINMVYIYIYDIFILRWFIMVRQVLTFLPHSRHVAISTPPQEQLLRRKGGTQRLERKIREWHFL